MQTKRVAYASFNFPTWQQVGKVFYSTNWISVPYSVISVPYFATEVA